MLLAGINRLLGSRSMPAKSGRSSPALKAGQGGRKAAFGRASAKAPGRSSAFPAAGRFVSTSLQSTPRTCRAHMVSGVSPFRPAGVFCIPEEWQI